jgi:hypothetical protein
VSYAGTDIAKGETVLRAGQMLTSREIGVLAAIGSPRFAFIPPGGGNSLAGERSSRRACHYAWVRSRFNAAIVGAAVEELGEPVQLGVIPDNEPALAAALAEAAVRSGRALGRHLEGSGRPFVSGRRRLARPGHRRSWRGTEARQADLPCGHFR